MHPRDDNDNDNDESNVTASRPKTTRKSDKPRPVLLHRTWKKIVCKMALFSTPCVSPKSLFHIWLDGVEGGGLCLAETTIILLG